MEIQFTKEPLDQIGVELLVAVCVAQEGEKNLEKPKPAFLRRVAADQHLDKVLGGYLTRAIQDQTFLGNEGETLVLHSFGKTKAKHIVLVGMGAPKKFSLETTRRMAGSIVQVANRLKSNSVAAFLNPAPFLGTKATERLQALFEGALIANYQFDSFRGKNKKPKNTLKKWVLQTTGNTNALKEACQVAEGIVSGVNLARELTNLPPNKLNPTTLGKAALDLAKKYRSISCKVLTPQQIRVERMWALLAVSQGAKTPPSFIHLKYHPGKNSKTKIALVGKGITFDSGGLNIKTKKMEEMKMDMGGAAAVIGFFETLGKLKLGVAVEGFIPAAENMPGSGAYHPSDIIDSRAGKTIEIINTDAEGRLALADALDYACDTKPTYLIDMATLTGGAAYAVGEVVTPILGNDKKLIEKLLKAGEKAGEPAWELPIVQEYKRGLVDGPADIKNSGSGSNASTITGAIFLEEFIRDTKWAHMDIAYTSWAAKPRYYFSEVGATGNPIRTLTYFIQGL